MRNALAPLIWTPASVGLLFVRIVVGSAFVLHGYPKILHPTTWMGSHSLTLPWDGATFGPLPDWLQAAAAVVEFFGGIALVIGLLTRFAAFALCIDMIVAFVGSELPRGTPFVGSGHTLEPNLTYMAVSFLLLLVGPGVIALDAMFSASGHVRKRKQGSYYEHRGPDLVMPGRGA
ncbi:MAG: DoxX family protein [Vulcanimicrobiaceae bacterium]